MALQPPTKSLVVEGVSVAPPGSEKVVVQDASLSLAGRATASASSARAAPARSSLARLLVGVWRPVRGSVRLDGAALDQWSPEALGAHIGYLPQDVELLAGTVAQNIAPLRCRSPTPRPSSRRPRRPACTT